MHHWSLTSVQPHTEHLSSFSRGWKEDFPVTCGCPYPGYPWIPVNTQSVDTWELPVNTHKHVDTVNLWIPIQGVWLSMNTCGYLWIPKGYPKPWIPVNLWIPGGYLCLWISGCYPWIPKKIQEWYPWIPLDTWGFTHDTRGLKKYAIKMFIIWK